MFVPSGCFLRRGTSQPFWYFSVSEAFFSAGLVQAPAVFFLRHPDFSSGIFCVLRMPLAVFYQPSGIFRFPEHFFCLFCAGACRVFPPLFRFSSEIFHILRMLPAVFFPAIPVFWGFRSVFSAGLVQAFAVFFPRHPDFYPESFVFCGCCLPFFY